MSSPNKGLYQNLQLAGCWHKHQGCIVEKILFLYKVFEFTLLAEGFRGTSFHILLAWGYKEYTEWQFYPGYDWHLHGALLCSHWLCYICSGLAAVQSDTHNDRQAAEAGRQDQAARAEDPQPPDRN